nr:zinc-finger homeobox [Hymenolepis microstoma]
MKFSPGSSVNVETGPDSKSCVYCLAKLVHPRLGRGESYSCGYKPYRCEICNYSTVTKGNLAIHEQSDRHLNNVQEYDQQQKLRESNKRDLIKVPTDIIPPKLIIQTPPLPNSLPQNFFYFLEVCNVKSGVCPQDDVSSSLIEFSDHSLLCQVCGVFSTDNGEDLIAHAEQNRIPINMDLANQQVTSYLAGVWHCSLCSYRSRLKANFQLHCKTEKHAQRLSLLLHMWEGKRADLIISLHSNHPPVAGNSKGSVYCQLRCLPCNFFTYSVHKMRVHCQLPDHDFLAGIFGALVAKRNQLKTSFHEKSKEELDKVRFFYSCQRCEITYSTVNALLQHFQSSVDQSQLNRQLCGQGNINVFYEYENHKTLENQPYIPATIFNCNQGRGTEDVGAYLEQKEGISSAFDILESSFPHRCKDEKTEEIHHLQQLNPTDKPNDESVDEETSDTRRHSAPPTFIAESSFGSNNSTKRRGESGSNVDLSTLNDRGNQEPHSTLNGPLCQTLTDCNIDDDGIHHRMQIAADPLSFWLKLQNSEILQGLAKLFDEQKQQITVPRTCENLFTWFGQDNSLSLFVTCWLKYQFPQIDNAISNEFVALILESIAHQTNATGKFAELRDLQQRHASEICEQCTPSRAFLLPSSASIHQNLYHNNDLPNLVLEAFDKIENGVIQIVLGFQNYSQSQPSPVKRSRNAMTSDQLDNRRSACSISSSLCEETLTTSSKKTGLKDKAHDNKSNTTVDIPQTPSDQSVFTSEHSEKGQCIETSLRPTSSTKRFRTPISSSQQALLLKFFQADQNPSRRQMDIISSKVNLPKRVVQVWFQNARSRERRMYIKFSPCQSQSPKSNLLLPPIPTPPWQPREVSDRLSPLNELECLVSAANSANNPPDSTPNDKLQQIFSQILTQMPPLEMIPPISFSQVPPHLESQQNQLNELESPLDLSTVSYRSSDHHSPNHLQALSPQTGSATSANEARSDNFCRRNRTSISSTQARFMQWFFQRHKTPTICECENIGQAIGLSRRVVQVWFQNQRAKEKKLARVSSMCGEICTSIIKSDASKLVVESDVCELCNVKITRLSEDDTAAVTEHIFSKAHIDKLFSTICQGDSWSKGATDNPQSRSPKLSSK